MVAQKHDRFLSQSTWTKSIRDYLLSSISIDKGAQVLETGCGTGVILGQLAEQADARLFGIDKDFNTLAFASSLYPQLHLMSGTVEELPFANESIDLVFCHYFLLWLSDPLNALKEIYRVLKFGGQFIAFAEPDYLSRVDAPTKMVNLGLLQNRSLETQGCRLDTGRSLPGWLSKSGFTNVKFGISGFETCLPGIPEWLDSEWTTLTSDLSTFCSSEELAAHKKDDEIAWRNGERVLWVPTFYALGCKYRK